ncbi:MAG TPA: sigma-70 family RNA polymerase sigma factor [Planctomycetota bacterium]|nr:sigma-70 family RNA polymerase sigma factor [Planctomycetota bacterium]
MAQGGTRFLSTIWADIEMARGGDRAAYNRLIEAYRTPVVELLRRQGFKAADAEDLTQEIFAEIVEKNLLRKAAPEVGRFRSLLIGVTRNAVRNHLRKLGTKRRGGGTGRGPTRLDSRVEGKGGAPGDEAFFDQIWVVNLLNRALRRLETEAKVLGNRQDEIVRLAVLEEYGTAEIAGELKLGEGVVRNLLHRGKKKLLEFVRREIVTYTSPGGEREGEVDHILRLIGPRGGKA